jgi:hypothetical protein
MEGRSKSLYREQYDALGKRSLPAIERVVNAISAKPCAFNRQHPFVDVFLSDFTDSRELLDVSD